LTPLRTLLLCVYPQVAFNAETDKQISTEFDMFTSQGQAQ
jgi:hypothetical protein